MRDRDALRQIANEKGISNIELARRLGKCKNVISEQLRDKKDANTMNLAILCEYADALGYSVVLMEKRKASKQRFVLDDFNKDYKRNRYIKRRNALLAELEKIDGELKAV